MAQKEIRSPREENDREGDCESTHKQIRPPPDTNALRGLNNFESRRRERVIGDLKKGKVSIEGAVERCLLDGISGKKGAQQCLQVRWLAIGCEPFEQYVQTQVMLDADNEPLQSKILKKVPEQQGQWFDRGCFEIHPTLEASALCNLARSSLFFAKTQ